MNVCIRSRMNERYAHAYVLMPRPELTATKHRCSPCFCFEEISDAVHPTANRLQCAAALMPCSALHARTNRDKSMQRRFDSIQFDSIAVVATAAAAVGAVMVMVVVVTRAQGMRSRHCNREEGADGSKDGGGGAATAVSVTRVLEGGPTHAHKERSGRLATPLRQHDRSLLGTERRHVVGGVRRRVEKLQQRRPGVLCGQGQQGTVDAATRRRRPPTDASGRAAANARHTAASERERESTQQADGRTGTAADITLALAPGVAKIS